MGRPPIITNEKLLEAAREVFLAEGFGASTVKIARRAGVSEGTLFKRFSTKEELFFAAMGISDKTAWLEDLENLVGKGDLKDNLLTLAFQIIESFREILPRLLMMQSKGILPSTVDFVPPPLPFGLKEPPPVRILKALTVFFEGELKLGRLRPCKPESMARIFLGPVMNYVMLEQLIQVGQGSLSSSSISTSTFVHDLIDILWQGIAPS
jgi:AcrR family transcriptional regulator